jgi:hypothetical protein
MSTYTNVVPVAWPRMRELLAGWAEVFAGRSSPAAFRERFCPGARLPSADLPLALAPPGYLDEIGWRPGAAWLPADALRRSPAHAALSASGLADMTTYLLLSAIKHFAAVAMDWRGDAAQDIIGAGERRAAIIDMKNRIHFLEAVFEATYHWPPDGWIHYSYTRLPGCDRMLAALLERLFLATRGLPGLRVLPRGNTWLAVNAHLIQGYLLPGEVGALARRLEALGAPAAAVTDGHFEPFVRQVGLVAGAGYGLVAMQDFS